MKYKPLPKEFFRQDTLTLARQLLGKYLVHQTDKGTLVCQITETEAYCGPDDAACHSYKNRAPDGRTNIMYGEGGHAYVYLIYGMYHCFNVVSSVENQPEAVLIRSAKAVEGLALMQELRRSKKGNFPKEKDLLTGPGKLCIAMDISRKHYGLPLWEGELTLCEGVTVADSAVKCGPRINVDYAGEDALLPYRFCDVGTGYLSGKI